jgi:hypothetical protein
MKKQALNPSNNALTSIIAEANTLIPSRNNRLNPKFIAALKAMIEGRETSKERLADKEVFERSILTVTVGDADFKVRIAGDSRCCGVHAFIQAYSDDLIILSDTASTRRVLLKDTKISSFFAYEVRATPGKKQA